jgi:uncharacterized protein
LDAPPPRGYSHGRMIPEQVATIAAGPGIDLEARVAVAPVAEVGVVVCHPHPLYGGDMDNPVVTLTAEGSQAAGLATLRFNFRGVGDSTGAHDDGRGEQVDVAAALDHLARRLRPGAAVGLAGYSFGAAMAAAVAGGGRSLAGLALIAPPLAFGGIDTRGLKSITGPVLIVAGSLDAYCPREALERLADGVPRADVCVIEGADHFFAGALGPLGEAVAGWARRVVHAAPPR